MTRPRLLATFAVCGLALVAASALMVGIAVKAAAQRGDLFPQMHWRTER